MYIGETGRRLGDRFREHLLNINNDSGYPVANHFNQSDHDGIRDIKVTGMISCSSDDRSRLSLENRFIDRFGVLHPFGMNRTLTHI